MESPQSWNQYYFLSAEVFLQQVAGAEFDEAGGGAVGAGDAGCGGEGGVHHEMDARSRRPHGAEDGGGADVDAGEVPDI